MGKVLYLLSEDFFVLFLGVGVIYIFERKFNKFSGFFRVNFGIIMFWFFFCGILRKAIDIILFFFFGKEFFMRVTYFIIFEMIIMVK